MFKELVKGHYRKAKARFSKKDEGPSEVYASYTPLKIFLHSTLSVDMTDFLLMDGQHPGFISPSGEFTVNAISWSEYDVGVTNFRVYVEDDSGNEFIVGFLVADDEVEDIMIFQQVAAFEPQTEAEWNRYLSQLGFQTLDDDGIEYSRVWGDKFTEKLPFSDNTFEETLVEKTGVSKYTNEYILYSREISSGETEWLLVGIEEGEGNPQLVYQVGYSVKPENLTVV